MRLQKSLLRFIEDGLVARIGETEPRKVHTRCVLASNAPGPLFGLAHDLVARLRLVEIPSLSRRIADIPSLFRHLLIKSFQRFQGDVDTVIDLLTAEHFESLCLDNFRDTNVRGLIAIADELSADVQTGTDPQKAVDVFFESRYRQDGRIEKSTKTRTTACPPDNLLYEDNSGSEPTHSSQTDLVEATGLSTEALQQIMDAHRDCDGGVKQMVLQLKEHHRFSISRQRLSSVLDLMGLARLRRRRKERL